MPDSEEYESYYLDLDNYFKTKSRYEKEHAENKRKIIRNTTFNFKERRKEISNLKPKCIQCLRPVGTIFSNLVDQNNKRILKMQCGDKISPCFHDTIFMPSVYTYPLILRELEEDIESDKKKMIIIKNEQIFGLISDKTAINNFDVLKKRISDNYTLHTETLKEYVNRSDNPEKEKNLSEQMILVENTMRELKKKLDLYEKTKDVQYVKAVVNHQIDSLMPSMKNIMNLRYNSSFVEYNDFDGTHQLRQNNMNIVDMRSKNNKKETCLRS
jgi:hypothetical protein